MGRKLRDCKAIWLLIRSPTKNLSIGQLLPVTVPVPSSAANDLREIGIFARGRVEAVYNGGVYIYVRHESAIELIVDAWVAPIIESLISHHHLAWPQVLDLLRLAKGNPTLDDVMELFALEILAT